MAQNGSFRMANGIVLTNAIRQNLLSLQNTGELQAKVQERLATGKKVNSALDGPTNFFTAAGLNRRATDLSTLLDGMMNGIKTLEAADKGMKGITQTVETMRAYVRQARQDKSFKGASYTTAPSATGNLTFSGGAVGTTPVSVAIPAPTGVVSATLVGSQAIAGTYTGGSFTIQAPNLNGGTAVSVTIANDANAAAVVSAINTALDAATGGDGGITATESGGVLTLTGTTGNTITVGGTASVLTEFGFTASQASTNGNVGTANIDSLVTTINTNVGLAGKVKASNDGGKLRIENLSTESLSLVGASATAVTGGTVNTTTIGGNEVRKSLIAQFNELRTQLDRLAEDAGYNGVNLLKADKLKIAFNEVSTSILEIEAKDSNGVVRPINTGATSLNITAATAAEFSDDLLLETRVEKLGDALTMLQTQSSAFGSSLSIVQVRQEFTKGMINTLEVGADNLTLADSNEEGANLLALNTRQQLAQTTLSLAAQAQQAVLRLFG
jgi:flagellin-like hook-associated protein FlgL